VGAIQTQLRHSKTSMQEVFANPGLRKLNLALTGSVMGDWAYALGAAVYVYGEGGPTAVGVLSVVRYVTMAFILPFAATLADKYDRKRIMIATDVLRFVLVTAAALLIWADVPAMVIYVLSLLISLSGSPFKPAERAMTPELARHPGELTGANVVASTIDSVAMFAGPAVAGVLLTVADIPVVFLFNAVTFLWSGVIVAGITVPDHGVVAAEVVDDTGELAAAEEKEGFFTEAGAGYRAVFQSKDISLLIGLYCAQTVVAGASAVFSVAIALDLLDIGKGGLGALEAVLGVGGLFGGFVALMLSQRGRLATDFGLGVVLWSAPLLLVAASPRLAPAVVMMALIGVANSIVDVNALTILQRLVPAETMGRVFGAMESAIIGAMAVGALAMPLLINTVGLRWGLAIIGGGVALLTLAALPALRRIDLVALAPEGLDVLSAVPMLSALPPSIIERLARSSKVINVAAGDHVFVEGDAGDLFYVIEQGEVDVTIRGEHTREISAGGFFGEIALLRDIPRTATITARTDLVLRAVERDPFVTAVTGHGAASDAANQVVTNLLQVR
jgi:MFS family permease